ncbi:hypothetical protein DENSPDRAFT_71938 [Dentipellis sp. KUC8613]|nr:hypothetical protein DENSPDRAFT_71938 [Dentipellis sp. KUC8613]
MSLFRCIELKIRIACLLFRFAQARPSTADHLSFIQSGQQSEPTLSRCRTGPLAPSCTPVHAKPTCLCAAASSSPRENTRGGA